MTYKVTQRSIARLMKNAEWISFRHSLDLISGIEYTEFSEILESVRDEAGHKIAPEMVTKLKIVLRTRLSTSNIFYFMSGTIVLVAVIYLTILPVLQDLES